MMDRNLGAMAGYTNVPSDPLGMSKANGFHYQWGRKDPFPSSYSASIRSEVSGVSEPLPVPDMLNQYGPDGLSYIVKQGVTQNVSLQELIGIQPFLLLGITSSSFDGIFLIC